MCLLLSTPYQQVQHHPETILEDVAKKLHRPILHLMDPQIFGLLLNSFTQTLHSFGLPFSIALLLDSLLLRGVSPRPAFRPSRGRA